MKKILPLAIVFLFFLSCEDNQTTVNTGTPYSLDETFEISLPQTASGQTTFSETSTQDLSLLIANYTDINSVTVNSLTYEFTSFSGDAGATIQSATLTVNNVVIATISNINIAQESANGTVFQITDPAIISQVETILETTSVVDLVATGTINATIPTDFHITVHLDIEAN